MPLPSSGPISLGMIRLFYGGAVPDSIFEYYRGGAYVPNTAANSAIPTSGTISLFNFYGQGGSGGGGALTATSSSANKTDNLAEPAPAFKTVTATGNVSVSGGSGSYTCTWAHLSGSTAIPTPAANVFSPSYSASVAKNDTLSAVKRCTVSDGTSSVFTDMSVNLAYFSS